MKKISLCTCEYFAQKKLKHSMVMNRQNQTVWGTVKMHGNFRSCKAAARKGLVIGPSMAWLAIRTWQRSFRKWLEILLIDQKRFDRLDRPILYHQSSPTLGIAEAAAKTSWLRLHYKPQRPPLPLSKAATVSTIPESFKMTFYNCKIIV